MIQLRAEWRPSSPRFDARGCGFERRVASHAALVTFCTDGARRIFAERYPETPSSRMAVIPNGYSERSFAEAERLAVRRASGGPVRLLHSGILYPTPDRDPTALFDAIASLRRTGNVSADSLHVTLRATGHDEHYRGAIDARGIADIVELAPAIPYRDALAEMLVVDGLLVLQGAPSNPAIPAKIYEYLRAGRPIFALVHHEGETATLLRKLGLGEIVPLEDADAIAEGLRRFLRSVEERTAIVAAPAVIKPYSREHQTAALAELLGQARG